MSTPQSQIYICSGVRLDNRYQHTIEFDSLSDQKEYFAEKVVKTFSAYSYYRNKWSLKVEATMAQASTWNYCYIVSPGESRYRYYFINSIKYISDSTVELELELDVMQTYYAMYSLLPCFVERTHVTDDTPGANTVPEGLEMGSYYNYHQFDMEWPKDMGILVLSAVDLLSGPWEGRPELVQMAPATELSGVYSGLSVYAYDKPTTLTTRLKDLELTGKIDGVVAIWMYPKILVTLKNKTWDTIGNDGAIVSGVINDTTNLGTGATHYRFLDEKIFQGYTPKNKKLYTHPYNLRYCTNNAGEKAEFTFENWTGDPEFSIFGAIGPDATVRLAPVKYNSSGSQVNYDEGINLGNFPHCAWNSDTYKVWLAQNYNQLAHSTQSAAVSGLVGAGTLIAGIATMNPALIGAGALATYNGYNQITGIMAQKEDAQAQPPQAKGNHSTTVNVTAKRQTFSLYWKCIRKEYAQQLDDFFTLYGYRINRVIEPNLKARKAFTFVKTVGCKIAGGMIQTEDVVKIQSIFDAGVTLWRNPHRVGDYTQDNSL